MTLTKAEIKEWRALFKSMNKNSRDKILTEDELVNWVNAHPDSGILTEENARMLFKTMDVNEDQVVTFSEFIDGLGFMDDMPQGVTMRNSFELKSVVLLNQIPFLEYISRQALLLGIKHLVLR